VDNLYKAEVDLDYDQDNIECIEIIAYADNLATVTGRPRAKYMHELQAAWFSAFCAYTRLVMHPAKVISNILGLTLHKYQQKSIIGLLKFKDKTKIIVHDHKWDSISYKVNAQRLSIKCREIQLDLQNKTSVAHKMTL
jgi:hypothetical protein